MRSDAARNRAAIVEAAGAIFRRDGSGASLEAIAMRAGVGSATLHRHFRGRTALLDAVFAETVAALAGAADLAGERPGEELWRWLDVVVRHCAADATLAAAGPEPMGGGDDVRVAWAPLQRVGGELLTAAQGSGTMRPDVTVDDLLDLVYALARAAAGDPERAARLLSLARDGLAG